MDSLLKTSFSPTAIEPFYTGGKVSLADDGKTLATSLGEQVIVTDLETGEQLFRIKGDTEIITTLEISPDARYLVTCSRSLQMKVYDLTDDAKLLRSVKAHEAPTIVMTIDATSSLIATGGAEGSVKVWDIEGGFVTHTFKGHGGIISALRFFGQRGSTNDWKLASGADDCKVRIWDLVKRKCAAVLDSHVSVIRGLDWSVDGKTLISGGRDKVVNVWHSTNGLNGWKLKRTIPVLETIETVGFLQPSLLANDNESESDQQLIYTGGDANLVRLWNISTSEQVSVYKGQVIKTATDDLEQVIITDIIYKPEHQLLYSINSDQLINKHSLESVDLPIVQCIPGHHAEILDAIYIGKDDSHLALAANSCDIRIVSVEGTDCEILTGHRDTVIALDRSHDGEWLVSASKDNEARLWRINTVNKNYECVATLRGHTGSVGAVGLPRIPINPRHMPSFILSGSQDLTIKKWEIASDGTAKTSYTRKAHDKDINSMDVSPNDALFATASQDRTVKIWDMASGESVGVLRGHRRGVWSVRFNHYDKLIVTSSGDKTVKLWNLNDYSCLRTFEGHTNSVLKACFLTKGMQIASAGGDGLVKIWETKTGECNATLDNHDDKIWSLAVRNDDKVIVSGGGDSVITFWEDTTELEVEKTNELKKEQIEKEQALSNFINKKDWKNAIILALELDQPYKLFKLFKEVVLTENSEAGSITGLVQVDEVIRLLNRQQLEKLLTRVRDWNTSTKSSFVAQRILKTILVTHNIDSLANIKNISQLVGGMLPYNNRHANRVDDLIEQSYILDFTLQQMAE
ncbi:WD40 repeat-like protein [Nadsonia fulvescens var. elongata DSM 6958]|uniref:WD40 repeat-like protein n=1 Tax=Nadsonia fulvescens var. elongata DSM 6958 TaxID=857566 RepID=A0A1E3PG57_9ASCO|nr:WD40 repeat-like protein [Nadsonia fulvescens var. elongata DSM 6958]